MTGNDTEGCQTEESGVYMAERGKALQDFKEGCNLIGMTAMIRMSWERKKLGLEDH